MTTRTTATALTIAAATFSAPAAPEAAPPEPAGVRTETITTEIEFQAETRRFTIEISTPAAYDPDEDPAVLLYSGGLTTDLHWTVPGTYEHQGETHQATISGQDTRDADTITDALLEAGFAVARYSSIHLDDEFHRANPVLADPLYFHDSLTLAQRFHELATDRLGTGEHNTYAVAHSLGATRAALTCAHDIAGLVTLAGAYLSPTTERPSDIIPRSAGENPQRARDADGSGSINPWEHAAAAALADGSYRSNGPSLMLHSRGYDFPSDKLIAADTPVLALWGSLDPTSYHGPILEHLYLASGDPDRLTTRYFKDLNHSLAPSDDNNRTGPIDPRVVSTIVEWISEQAAE